MVDRHITDYLVLNAARHPDKLALCFHDRNYTWRELHSRVETAANHIASLLPDDRQSVVGILFPNTDEFLITYLAIVHAGHIAMPLDPLYKEPEIQAVTEQLKPRFTITSIKSRPLFAADEKTVLVSEILSTDPVNKTRPLFRLKPSEQIATILFTSGTTGRPKAVPYSHTNYLWNPLAVAKLWGWNSEDTILSSLPLSHWHGLAMSVNGMLIHGNTLYLQEWFEAEETIKMLESGKVSIFMHVPVVYSKLIDHAKSLDKRFKLPKVRLFVSGSSYLPPRIWHDFKHYFGHEILERYGASEMGLLTSNVLDERIPGCVGRPLPGVKIEIQPDGEIAMKSPGLFGGHWRNKEATDRNRLPNGLWLSGDIGEFDADGRLCLKGRVQEKMKKFGYTVYPRDVEWILAKHPKIKDCVVMSVQNEDSLSDEFVYFVSGEASVQQIKDFAKKEMPAFWRPDRVIKIPAIPRTGRAQKPSLGQLRELL